jgi:hypothetical protein
MSYLVIVIIILAILGVFVFLQRLSIKEKERRELEKKAKRILARADEIWDIIETTSGYINSPDIFDALLAYYGFQIRQRDLMIDTDDTQEHLAKIEVFKGKLNTIKVKEELNSDTEINQAKRAFAQTSRLLRVANKKRMINGQAYNSMRNTLRRRILDLEVDIHEKLGDSAGEKNDPAVAANHYKFAKKLLIESDLKFEGKNQRVRDITTKTQILFGNVMADQLTQGINKTEETHDEFGIPKDAGGMESNKKNF